MSKKDNHIAEPSKLTRFRSFEEMKAAPFSFPSNKPLTQRQAEWKELVAHLRANLVANPSRQKKSNKKKKIAKNSL